MKLAERKLKPSEDQDGKPVLIVLVPGVLLVCVSIYIPIHYFYRQLTWTKTEARHLETEVNATGTIAYNVMEFTDANGNVQRIKDDDENDRVEGSDDQHFVLYYNPKKPDEFVMMNPGRYLIAIFLPFGLLCCYLGWPHKTDKRVKPIR
jgi:hypothetical protein